MNAICLLLGNHLSTVGGAEHTLLGSDFRFQMYFKLVSHVKVKGIVHFKMKMSSYTHVRSSYSNGCK